VLLIVERLFKVFCEVAEINPDEPREEDDGAGDFYFSSSDMMVAETNNMNLENGNQAQFADAEGDEEDEEEEGEEEEQEDQPMS